MALTMGMPPATAASKLSATPFFSASAARLGAMMGEQRLVGGDDMLAGARARPRRQSFATPSSPPINSTNTSMASLAASRDGSSNHAMPERSRPRSLARSPLTAVTSIARPQRCFNAAPFSSSKYNTPAPTVPSPASPILSGFIVIPARGPSNFGATPVERLAALSRSQRDDVMHRRRRFGQEFLDVAGGLPNALLIFHKGEADPALAHIVVPRPT